MIRRGLVLGVATAGCCVSSVLVAQSAALRWTWLSGWPLGALAWLIAAIVIWTWTRSARATVLGVAVGLLVYTVSGLALFIVLFGIAFSAVAVVISVLSFLAAGVALLLARQWIGLPRLALLVVAGLAPLVALVPWLGAPITVVGAAGVMNIQVGAASLVAVWIASIVSGLVASLAVRAS